MAIFLVYLWLRTMYFYAVPIALLTIWISLLYPCIQMKFCFNMMPTNKVNNYHINILYSRVMMMMIMMMVTMTMMMMMMMMMIMIMMMNDDANNNDNGTDRRNNIHIGNNRNSYAAPTEALNMHFCCVSAVSIHPEQQFRNVTQRQQSSERSCRSSWVAFTTLILPEWPLNGL